MARVRGGLMQVVETLAGEQARAHAVLVLSPLPPRGSGDAPQPAWHALHLRGNADLAGHLALLRALRAARPDVVLLHAGSPGELALASALAAGIAPAVVVEHAPDRYPLRRPLRDAVLQRMKRRCRRHVCVSTAGARSLERLWHLPEGRLITVHNGAERPKSAASRGASVDDRQPRPLVAGFGAPTAPKGFDIFLAVSRALAAGPEAARFLWIGGGSVGGESSLEVQPWRDGLGDIFANSTLVLLPSRAEGLPLTLLEAMACGRAIVASAVGGVPEAVQNGREAVLLPAGDVAAWTATVAELLGDAARRAELGRAARARWEAEFTAAAMAARWDALLETVWR